MAKTAINAADFGVKDETVALSKKIAPAIKIENDGVVTVDASVYEQCLPEGLTIDTVKAVSNFNANFAAGAGHALGTAAESFLKRNKGVSDVSAKFKADGRNAFEMVYHRNKEKSGGPGAERVQVPGALDIKFKLAGMKGGQVNKVKDFLTASAAATLAD